jgi:hypothetical protein
MTRDARERAKLEGRQTLVSFDPGEVTLKIHEFEYAGERVKARGAEGGTPSGEDTKVPEHAGEDLVLAGGEVETWVKALAITRGGEDPESFVERSGAGEFACSSGADAVAREALTTDLGCDPAGTHGDNLDATPDERTRRTNSFTTGVIFIVASRLIRSTSSSAEARTSEPAAVASLSASAAAAARAAG